MNSLTSVWSIYPCTVKYDNDNNECEANDLNSKGAESQI